MVSGCGLKLRSCRVASDSSTAVASFGEKSLGLAQSCWARMPRELLREILTRIEASESTWPSRMNVVACAGVCRSWRDIVKEVVERPEISGKLTFPISLKQPGPRNSMIQCFIRRNKSTQTFHLYVNSTLALADSGKFLLAACRLRRPTCRDYLISLHPNEFSKGYIGKLRSNFVATKFIINDALPPHDGGKMLKSHSLSLFGSKRASPKVPVGNYPVAHVSYEMNPLGSRVPRKMQCIMDAIPASAVEPGGLAPTQTELPFCRSNSFPSFPSFSSKSRCKSSTSNGQGALVMRNKSPRWHEQLQCWCLNFHGRVTVASVKNFQLVAAHHGELATPEWENVILQFGKVGNDVFTMDYAYPLSAFQAFAICLSSFDTRIVRD